MEIDLLPEDLQQRVRESTIEFLNWEELIATLDSLAEYAEHAEMCIRDRYYPARRLLTLRTLKTVSVVDGDNSQTITTDAQTVQNVLEELQIKLGIHDRVEPELTEECTDTIKITRVEKKQVVEEVALDYAIEKKEDPHLYKGEQRILEKGKKLSLIHILKPAMEDTLIIFPLLFALKRGIMCLQQLTTDMKLMFMIKSQSALLKSSKFLVLLPIAALLTKTSTVPKALTTSLIISLTLSSSATSTFIAKALT